jgi:hypothetical protein
MKRSGEQVDAARALWKVTEDVTASLPALIQSLEANTFTARTAAIVLAEMGPAASDAIPHLEKALEKHIPGLRRDFHRALKSIRGNSATYGAR